MSTIAMDAKEVELLIKTLSGLTESLAVMTNIDSAAPERRAITAKDVVGTVANYYKVSSASLKDSGRRKNEALRRHVAMMLLRRFTKLSYPEIGDLFLRDHTSVLYACRTFPARLEVSPDLDRDYRTLTTYLEGWERRVKC